MCKGKLVDGGAATFVTNDFDTNTRPEGAAPDIGCYESGSGAHWAISSQFKGSDAPPVTPPGSSASRLAPLTFLFGILF